MSANSDDIRVRIAGDMADIKRALQDLKRQTRDAGKEAARSSGDWNKLGRGLDDIRGQVKGLVAGYLSIRGVSALFGGVIRATQEAEDAAAQLEARVKSTGGAAGLTARQLLDMASALQQTTRFGDEAIAGVESILLTFTKIRGDEFESATTAALDLATALGTDLNSAALQVGKALNDPVRGVTALQRAGVQLTDTQREQVKRFVEVNDVASAQRLILAELANEMGGAAEAGRETLGGALESLKNAFGDLLEGSGGSIDGATDALNNLTETLQDPATKAAFAALAASVSTIVGLLAKVGVGFVEMGQGIGVLLGQFVTGIKNPNDQLEVLEAGIQRARKELDRLAALKLSSPADKFLLAQIERERNAAEQALRNLQAAKARLEQGGQLLGGTMAGRKPQGGAPAAAVAAPIDARPALQSAKASIAAAGTLLDDALKRTREQLDRDLSDNIVAFSDYYKKRAELERQAIDQRLAEQRNGLALLDEEIRLGKERADDVSKQEGERKKLVSEITVLERQRADVAVQAARDQADAEKNLRDQLADVRDRLLELQGNTVAARTDEIERQYADLLSRLEREGNREGQQLVKNLIDTEALRVRLDQVEKDYEDTIDALSRSERRVELQVETGNISESEGRRRIIDLHTETADKLRELIPLMEELAAATGDPEALQRLEQMKLEVEELASTAQTAFAKVKQDVRDAGEDAFASWLSGAEDAKSAWDSFVDDLRKQAAQLVSERIFDKIFGAIGGGGAGAAGASGGGGGFFKQLFGAILHQGGVVGAAAPSRAVPAIAFAGAPRLHGGGFLAPDERAAILQTGEEVLSRNDPRNRRNGGGVNVFIQTPNVQSFRRTSTAQVSAKIAASMIRAKNRNG